MSRDTRARRRHDSVHVGLTELHRDGSELDEVQEQADRLGTENDRLREQVAEVEGWYRLLQADHTALQTKAARSSRRVTELQAESNRLASENQDLQSLVFRYEVSGGGTVRPGWPSGLSWPSSAGRPAYHCHERQPKRWSS